MMILPQVLKKTTALIFPHGVLHGQPNSSKMLHFKLDRMGPGPVRPGRYQSGVTIRMGSQSGLSVEPDHGETSAEQNHHIIK